MTENSHNRFNEFLGTPYSLGLFTPYTTGGSLSGRGQQVRALRRPAYTIR
jgi:hypothetical protein